MVDLALPNANLRILKIFRLLRVLRPLRIISKNEGLKVIDNSNFLLIIVISKGFNQRWPQYP